MATDVVSQRADVIAKDILIAALQAERVHVEGGTPESQGESLAAMYVALLNGIRQRSSA
ncbi:hypothetical protein [Pseudoxanthomonas japonensis]|uniref:hypothetical protein n=1 Tax=Pseudoxanthomonas japonensis TaxID=69284 RepID=UPI003748032B